MLRKTLASGSIVLVTLWGPVPTAALAAEAAADTHRKKPLHEVLLERLRTTDALKPSLADVHPVTAMYNREAVIPPQCYTRTEQSFNPCYVCHQNSIGHENVMNDGELQHNYSFSDLGTRNHWKNLFEDRSERLSGISDDQILDWVADDNYSALGAKLKATGFTGWIPDLENLHQGAQAFDKYGFAKDGSHWVAFNYKPMPSTFWPTNGSTDDVMIRLAPRFRQDKSGRYSRDVYRANLAIVEATIKGVRTIGTLPVDEKEVARDLDGDGELSIATRITDTNAYVGAAEGEYLEPYLYPAGTEFLHTVRYIGLDGEGSPGISTRMKEVRYMRKWRFYNKPVYARYYDVEIMEKEMGHLPGYTNLGDHGLDNGFGWSVQGFIENRKGELRVATFEENTFCMGCHGSIGSTIDKTFSFARKIDGAAGWGYIDLRGMRDAPTRNEIRGEIETYLERVGGGSEFRNNDEMKRRWFRADGSLDVDKVRAARDVYELLMPSKERALSLNKAYKLIVEDQDFIYGRDAILSPPEHVYDRVDNVETVTLPLEKVYKWDIRLDWGGGHSVVAAGADKGTARR